MDPNLARAAKNLARLDYHRQSAASTGGGGGGFDSCGPPHWDRAAWESFRASYGSYPFGPQKEGGVIQPPSFDGAPDWVFELMGMRVPPVRVMSGPTGMTGLTQG